MTDPLTGDPALGPIREAVEASGAGAAGAAETKGAPAKRKRKTPCEEDAESIKRAFKKIGEAGAMQVGRVYGWSDAELKHLLFPPPPPKPSDAAPPRGGGEDGREDKRGSDAGGDGPTFTRKKNPIKPLGPDCPVTPLGKYGKTLFFLNPLNELVDMKDRDLGAPGIRALFCQRGDWLWENFPKYSAQTGLQSGWKVDEAQETLIDACARKGVVNAFERVRGVGAWCGHNSGDLILHCGDRIYYAGEWLEPGSRGDFIYTHHPASAAPANSAAAFKATSKKILALFDTWNWREIAGAAESGRGQQALFGGHKAPSLLMLGWIGQAMFGGALKWRSHVWLTGDAGSGKSELLNACSMIIGDMVKAADATPAGVWSELGMSTRPVLLDETENDPNSPKNRNLVEFARKNSSGDQVLRGSSGHVGVKFTAKSAFLFSSIIIPPMQSQDRSRITMLDLDQIDGGKTLNLDANELAAFGAILRRRILDKWDDWDLWLKAWEGELVADGHKARGARQIGTVLAMADMLRGDELSPAADRAELTAMFPPERDLVKDADVFRNHILSIPLDVFRSGTRLTVQHLVQTAAGRTDDMAAISGAGGESPPDKHNPEKCREALKAHGIFVDRDRREKAPAGAYVVVLPNQGEGLRRLLDNTRWRSDPGANGGWVQSMRRIAGAYSVNSRKYNGRGWAVPVGSFLMEDVE